MPRPRRRRRTGPRPLVLLLGLLFVAGAYMLLQSPLFRVAEVEVRGAVRLREHDVLAWAGLDGQVQIWQVDAAEVERRLRRHPLVAGAAVRRDWPNRLVIELLEREPVAYLPYYDRWLAVDAEGMVIDLADAPPAGVPRLETGAPPDLRVGQRLPEPVLPAVRTAAFIRQYALDWVEAVVVHPDAPQAVDLLLRGGVPARLGHADDQPERKLAVLAALWREWGSRPERVALIDVSNPDKPSVRTR